MSREIHVRFREGGGVRFPSATRLVACFQDETDARRFLAGLEQRLGRFGLEVEPTKTRLLRFGRYARGDAARKGEKLETFEFLGLQHYCGRSRSGAFKLKWRTSSARFRSKLRALREWVREHLTLPSRDLWAAVNAKLRGHYAYYGVSDNSPRLYQFRQKVYRLMRWAMNRRSQRRAFSLARWKAYVQHWGLQSPGKLVNLNPSCFFEKAPVGSRMR